MRDELEFDGKILNEEVKEGELAELEEGTEEAAEEESTDEEEEEEA